MTITRINPVYAAVGHTHDYTKTAVKGNAESSYRTGNVNLTYPNIGTCPVANGGTGATSAANARSNLGLSGIGVKYEASTSSISMPAGMDTYVNGAKLTLPAGTYVFYGQWSFNSASNTNGTACTVGFGGSGSGVWADSRHRVIQYNQRWNALTCTYLCVLSSQTDVYIKGASEVARTGCGSFFRAVRIL